MSNTAVPKKCADCGRKIGNPNLSVLTDEGEILCWQCWNKRRKKEK